SEGSIKIFFTTNINIIYYRKSIDIFLSSFTLLDDSCNTIFYIKNIIMVPITVPYEKVTWGSAFADGIEETLHAATLGRQTTTPTNVDRLKITSPASIFGRFAVIT